jgi:arginyl-tRNA synthetase
MDYKKETAEVICRYVNSQPQSSAGSISTDELAALIVPAPSADVGDLAFPCFKLAKVLHSSPQAIADNLAECFNADKPGFITQVQAVKGYLNIFLDRAVLTKDILERAAAPDYGKSDIGAGRVITIDYSSPNIAKHFHVGHLGTTIIGHALYNILAALGYKVVGINYLGDWGTQFGKLITAYKKWGDHNDIEQRGIDGLTELYVKFHVEADKDPSLEDEARAWMLKMQDGDEEALSLWKWFGEMSMKEYQRVYKRLGITFDSYRGESYYNDKLEAVVDELRAKNLLKESDGAQIVDLSDYHMPPCLVLRSDGGTLYTTRDLAAAKDRKETYNFYKSLYVTALDQDLHFNQFFKVLELMGYGWAKDLIHISYGLVVFEQGKLSTRKGNVIKMEDLLNEAVAKTREIIAEKNPDLPDKDTVAEQVGVGAVIFNQLYNSRIKDVLFSWDRMLNFDGETGPYVQYTHARANSVLEKASAAGRTLTSEVDYSLLADACSYEVVKLLKDFPGRVAEAADKYEPYIVSRYLVALAQAFNKFYHENMIITDDQNVSAARLCLTGLVKKVLASGLALLGIAAPERM